MRIDERLDLTYCTNIHPADGWEEVFRNLAVYGPALKRRLSPDGPFGIGLRISDRESRELLEANHLAELAGFLERSGLYVALLNGYIHGAFHGTAVKADVFAPDWRCEERVRYTLRLARVLEMLLPEGVEGGISSAPLSYKPWIRPDDRSARADIVRNLVRVAAELVRIERETGKRIRLEIEPEPDGLIENSAEVVSFFQEWLLGAGTADLAARAGLSREEAARLMLEHVCVCFDTCHLAIEYEEPEAALDALAAAGIPVGRVQLSSALRISLPADNLAAQLLPFEDSTYLHQVIERRRDGSLRRFRDLGEALATGADGDSCEWRIHFHVPLFAPGFGNLGSTREHITRVLRRLKRERFTDHLEIETYTWGVLPKPLKLNLTDSIEREYRWVLEEMCGRPSF